MIPEVEALRREVAELRANQLQLEDVRAWMEGRPQPSAQNTVEPHSVRDNAIGMLPFCYVRKTANQTVGAGAAATLTWDSASTSEAMGDPYGMHATTDNTRIKVTRRGWYWAHAQVGWATAAAGTRVLQEIVKGGAPAGTGWRTDSSAGTDPALQVSGLFYMEVGESLQVVAFNGAGVARDVLGTSEAQYRSKFCVIWMHDNVAPPLPA